MQACRECGTEFPFVLTIEGVRLDLRGRQRCLDCRPHRPLSKPRKRVVHPIATRVCESCGEPFALRQVIDGKLRYFYNRRFCTNCSPLGAHNTSKYAPSSDPHTRRVRRRRSRAQSFLRYQRKRRRERKTALIEGRGSRCEDCGYSECLAALEFHHRDPGTKEFGIGSFTGSTARLRVEAAKCDLLCASCHRIRHAALERVLVDRAMSVLRRERKERAIALMGRTCFGCGRHGPPQLYEFHHRDASQKDFGISEDGILRRWEQIVAELAKCVMLCANCHREVHAGVREIDDGLLGLAEERGAYVFRAA